MPDERARLGADRRAAPGRRARGGDQRRGRRRRRAQHVLHPRERRQQALRHPRPPQVAEGPQAGHADRRGRLPRPEGPRPPSRTVPPTSTWCSAPTTSTGPPSCSTRRRRRASSIVEILEETVADDLDTFPSALPVRREVPWAGWVTIQIGCDNSCAFCIVPAVRGREISRPFDHIVEEVRQAADEGVTEVTLLGQNVNSYGRDLTLAARQAGGTERIRPLFDQLLRAVGGVDGIERVRYTSPHPKDLRPETIAAMAETPDGVRAPPPAAPVRAAIACWPPCTAATRRSATWSGWPPLAPPSTTSPSPPTSSWASPARPTTTSSAPSRSPPKPPTTAPTPSSTAPGPAPRPPSGWTTTCPPTSSPSASSGSASSSSGRGWPSTRRGSGRVEEVLVEGPSRKDPERAHRAHAAEQARPLPVRPDPAGQLRHACAVTERRAAPPAGRAGRGHPPGRPQDAPAPARRLITITEEPYDGADARALVPGAAASRSNERYADGTVEWSDEDEPPMTTTTSPRSRRSWCEPAEGAFLVAWLDGEPVGCGAVKPLDQRPSGDRTIGEIKRMYTAPVARAGGATSRALLVAPRGRAAELGYQLLQLETGLAQPEAIALYESHGWHRITPYGHYKDSPQSVCFAKDRSVASPRRDERPSRRPRRAHGVREVGPRPGARPAGRHLGARVGGLHAGVPRHGHRHRQAHRRRASRGAATTCSTCSTRGRTAPSPGSSSRRGPRSRTSSSAATARCWSAGPRSTCRRRGRPRDPRAVPGRARHPRVRRRHARRSTPSSSSSTRSPPVAWSRPTAGGSSAPWR